MPQLDSIVLFSQAQLILYFFLGFYFFIYFLMPIIFVALSVSNEFTIYKYHKHQQNMDEIAELLSNKNGNECESLILLSKIERYKHTKLTLYLD